MVTDEDNVDVKPSHIVTGPEGVSLTDTPALIVITVTTVLSQPLTDVKTSVYVPADVYVLPLIVYAPPEQKLCGLLVSIAAASPTTTVRVSVHPQLSVTVTV